MTMTRWTPDMPLSDLFDNLFGSLKNEGMERKKYECLPLTNILEKNDSFELYMALPGVRKEDVKIDLEKNILSISSDRSAESKDKEADFKYTRREFVYGTFCRSFNLPDTIDTEKITADMKDGILKITLPKKQEARLHREIKIS